MLGAALLTGGMAACGEAEPTLSGVWSADDGTPAKVISEDGSCTGMYYHDGQPLDIGGEMRCTLGSRSDDGTYTLIVQQPPNQRSYTATFPDADTLVLTDGTETVVTLSRR